MQTTAHDTPAFPCRIVNDSDRNTQAFGLCLPPGAELNLPGMSLRDYFAAQAAQGMAQWALGPADAARAYRVADWLLAARAQTSQ